MRVNAPVAGRLKATALRGSRTVAKGSKSVKAGRASVRLRFTKAARSSLRSSRRVKLRVKVTLGRQQATVPVTLKR